VSHSNSSSSSGKDVLIFDLNKELKALKISNDSSVKQILLNVPVHQLVKTNTNADIIRSVINNDRLQKNKCAKVLSRKDLMRVNNKLSLKGTLNFRNNKTDSLDKLDKTNANANAKNEVKGSSASVGQEGVEYVIDMIDNQNLKLSLLVTDCEGNLHILVFKVNYCK